MDVAGAGVQYAAVVMVGAHALMCLGRVHISDVRIVEACPHRLGVLDIFGQVALAVADIEMAGTEIDLDLVDRGEFEQVRLSLLGDVEQRLGAREAEFLLQLLRAGTLTRAKLAAIAARRAVADPVAFDQHDVCSGLGEMRRRRKACEATANDDDVGREIAVEGSIVRSRTRSIFVP